MTKLDRGKANLPDFLEHFIAVLVPIGIPAGGESQGPHEPIKLA